MQYMLGEGNCMSSEKPDNENQVNSNPADVEQSEALRQAMLKLQKSGMLTHIPEDLATASGITQDDLPDTEPPSVPEPSVQVPEPEDESDAILSGWDDAPVASDLTLDPSPTIPSRSDITIDLPNDAPEKDEAKSSEDAHQVRRKEILPVLDNPLTSNRDETPWTLQQFFDGEIDLEQELTKRHPTVPAMTRIKFRTLGTNSGRKVATLSTQDGNATLIVDADTASKVVQLSFNYGTMMTLRYSLQALSQNNRERWLELMRREKGGMAFLWNENRWQNDYIICVSREVSTHIFAFSPHNFESTVRLTKDITEQLLNWLEDIWNTDPNPPNDDDAPLLTW